MMASATFIGLVLGTLASEDLTCIAAGLLVAQHAIDPVAATAACALGIFAGDVGLWALGRGFGAVALQWPWVARNLTGRRATELQDWIEHHASIAIVGSRVLPGTRLPLYVIAGVFNVPAGIFAWWAGIGAVLWTPILVGVSAAFGRVLAMQVSAGPLGWIARAALVAALLCLLRSFRRESWDRLRFRGVQVKARLARWRRWEFWPMWLFYAPVAAWVALLACWYRGLSVITASNPGIPDGGTVGESKHGILSRLPREWTIPFGLIDVDGTTRRVRQLTCHMMRHGWSFPVVLKPDVGQRGAGVRLVSNVGEAAGYLYQQSGRVLVQPYHNGPFEAGVFYYRLPTWPRGRILSITDKEFPFIVGDGHSTIERLIWQHPRYCMQASTFLRRHRDALATVLPPGERFQLAMAGNHAQGTMFRDGYRLLTPELAQRIDDIARQVPGFFVGRFDIKYRNEADFMAGRDLAIVELNGATAESTNIYDPATSLVDAYRQLFRQWSIVFAIGAANRAAGAPTSSWRRMATLVHAHMTTPVAFALSD